jgi:hypothetical protein
MIFSTSLIFSTVLVGESGKIKTLKQKNAAKNMAMAKTVISATTST